MKSNNSQVTPPKIHPWRYLPIIIILGLGVHLLVPQITQLEHSWAVVKNLTWWAVALAVIAQILSYLGNGFLLHNLASTEQNKLTIFKGALISMASASVGLVAGGWLTGAAVTYGWIKKEKSNGSEALLAGTLPSILNNGVLLIAALFGTLYLLIIHDLSKSQMIEFRIILLILAIIAITIYISFQFPERMRKLLIEVLRFFAKLCKKPFNPERTISSLEQFLKAWNIFIKSNWVKPVLGAIANVGFDMLTLYFVFVAAGDLINPGILFAGYGLPLFLGKIAFIIPGGLGVVEGSMVALYDSLNVPNEVSVVVILGYRLISFWIPTILGFIAATYLTGRSSKKGKNQNGI
jgi:uncharacterized protein (TIRG00374 family)